jgi:hypothetical protein
MLSAIIITSAISAVHRPKLLTHQPRLSSQRIAERLISVLVRLYPPGAFRQDAGTNPGINTRHSAAPLIWIPRAAINWHLGCGGGRRLVLASSIRIGSRHLGNAGLQLPPRRRPADGALARERALGQHQPRSMRGLRPALYAAFSHPPTQIATPRALLLSPVIALPWLFFGGDWALSKANVAASVYSSSRGAVRFE